MNTDCLPKQQLPIGLCSVRRRVTGMNAGLHSPLSKFHPNSALQIKNSAELLNLLPLLHTVTLYFPSPLLLRSKYFTLSPTFFYHQMESLQSSRLLCFLVPSLTKPQPPAPHSQANTRFLLATVSSLSFQSSKSS